MRKGECHLHSLACRVMAEEFECHDDWGVFHKWRSLICTYFGLGTILKWRPGIGVGVTQRHCVFKPITWYAKSRATKSIPGLYGMEANTLCFICLCKYYFGLGVTVIIKIKFHPCYPISFDWFSWDEAKKIETKIENWWTQKKLSFSNSPIFNFRTMQIWKH